MRVISVWLMSCALGFAQQPLTNEDIVKSAKAGLGDDVIIGMIQQTPGNFNIAPDSLIALKAAGISDKVIGVMVNKRAFSLTRADEKPEFQLKRGQSVYVVGLETASGDLGLTKVNLDIERHAREEFRKRKFFETVNTLGQADFVFVVILDEASQRSEEVAIAILPHDYRNSKRSMDDLRERAIWQDTGRSEMTGKQAAVWLATVGLSAAFPPSITKGLVVKLHKACCRP